MEDKKVKKIIIIVMLISILLLGLTGIVSAQENIIKIGVAVSLTGKLAYEGRLNKDGYEVWEDWVNSHGGITAGGINYKVKMVYYDDESNPVRGAKLTEMLITQNKVDFLFGPYSSAITFATTAIGEKYKIITIAPEASSPAVYERGYKYLFSVLTLGTTTMVPLLYMAENLDPKPKTVAIITTNDLAPLTVAEGTRDKCKELGFEVVLFGKYPVDTVDISALLTQVKDLNPDILASCGNLLDSLMVMRQCKEVNVNPKIYTVSMGVMVPNFVQELGADAEYVFGYAWWLPTLKGSDKVFGTTADYVQACKDKFGPDYMPGYDTSCASTAGTLLQLAIEKADSIETEKVREALSTLDVELATWPAIAFNEKGQNIKWEHPIAQIQNGKKVIVYPETSQENAPMYPAPEWKER